MDWATEARLELTVNNALAEATERIQELDGKNRLAVQQEFLEWSVMGWNELEVEWFPHYGEW